MSIEPKFTVYIASHNYGRYLSDAIESVLRQTVDAWELIIIDDGSTDETPQIVDRYSSHPRISVFCTDNIGLPSVCNLALENAKGKYIIRLDGDDIFDENILLILGHHLDRNNTLSLVFPDYYLIDEGGEIFSHERRRKLHSDDHLMELPPNGACTLVRTNILRQLGGYRVDLGAQDGLDLWVKLKDNYNAANINLPLFYYRRHGKNLTEKPLKIINARRELKKSATINQLNKMRPIIAVIPCRRHYDFNEDLWNELLAGQTLLERDIEACINSELIDRVVVTCDNPDAEKTLLPFKSSRLNFVLRDERSTIRSSNIVDTLKVVTNKFDPHYSGITIMRYVQTPFVSTGTIDEAITSLAVSGADSANAIELINSTIYRRTAFGLVSVNNDYGHLVGGEKLYRDSSTCLAIRNSNLIKGSLTGSSMAGFAVSAVETFFINSSNNLSLARSFAEQKIGT